MENASLIGLDLKKSQILSEELNILLANYQLLYVNLRGFHWNIKGEKFFELHAKFEELYNDVQIKIDEIAERILTLGFVPEHTFSDYQKKSAIKEAKNVFEGTEAVSLILQAFKILLVEERKILKLASDAEDEGTNSLMSDYIKQKEKQVWMFSAYLQKK